MELLSEQKIEGHYRLISHNEKREAIYAKLDENGRVAEWVRNWRDATTWMTIEQARAARDAARAADPAREINIAQRFYDWKKQNAKGTPPPQPAHASEPKDEAKPKTQGASA